MKATTLTPALRLWLLIGGTFLAWVVVFVTRFLAPESAWPVGLAAAVNLITFVRGIWTPPPAWTRGFAGNLLLALAATIAALSSLVLGFAAAWAGAHTGRF